MKKFLNLLFGESKVAKNTKNILDALEKENAYQNEVVKPSKMTEDQVIKAIDWTGIKLVSNGSNYSYKEYFLGEWIIYPHENKTKKQILEIIYKNQQRDLRDRKLESTFTEVEV